jgi:hypothetical protein
VHQGGSTSTRHLRVSGKATPLCPVCQRSNGYSATVDSNGNLKSATVRRQFAQKSEQRQKAHRIVNSTCPVHHRTVRWPRPSELQRSNPNGWVTWLAHRTVRCAHRQQPNPNGWFGGWGYKYPNHHHFKASKFSDFTFNTRAGAINTRHKFKESKPLQVTNPLQANSD